MFKVRELEKAPKWDGHTPKDAIERIAKLSTDVVEVRHAHWVGMDGDECSECGRRLRDIMDADSYYAFEFEHSLSSIVACPYCGARMDGEGREK